VLKPLVLDHVIPQNKPPVPAPTVVIKVNNKTGERITTIVQPNGSTETIDVKPNGTEVITKKNADGTGSVSIVPPKP